MDTPAFPPVSVGQTAYPLRSDATARGPLPAPPAAPGAPDFHLLDGPPYANGAPHLGHVLNKHLKDAVARAAAAQGHQMVWRPGWDCHGLPLELAVEKTGVARTDRPAFLAAARAHAQSQVDLQASVFTQQGWCAQWGQPWTTQDPQMEAGTLRVLADLLDAGRVQARFAAVPWCPRCQSTLSGAEQEPRSLTTQAWLVPFALDDGDQLLSWTTTPWTLPLHRALVVHPDARYAALALDGVRAWVSEETAEHWATVLSATLTDQRCTGQALAGRAYRTPWTEHTVVADARVLPAAGTGVLHAVPGLAELDTALARDYGWETLPHLAPNGTLQQSPCSEQLGTQAGSPASTEPVRMPYAHSPWHRVLPYTVEHPHCWRHHVPLLTRPSRQVFLVLDDEVRHRARAMVEQLHFTPESARARLQAAMATRPDWCLSRQRTWGVPLSLFLDRATGQPHARAATWMRRVADAMQVEGVQAWWSRPSGDWLDADVLQDEVDRVDDVLDVWFDSGCVPQLVGAADVVVEGTDQHRGWFQSCLWLAAALDRPLPFKRVVTHGFVLGADGQKLSKSTGGDVKGKQPKGPPPWHQLPTDVVRLWALAGSEGHDKAWSLATVQSAQGASQRLRGVLRFLLANALPQATRLDVQALPAWDRYWWSELTRVVEQSLAHCVQGRTGEALALALPFADTFSSVVLGAWKDRLYCAPAHTVERQQLDGVLRACLVQVARLMSVLMPRALSEAEPFWSADLPSWENPVDAVAPPSVSLEERQEVERVLATRAALATALEQQAKDKGGPTVRRVSGQGLPAWEGQLLADALGVGQVGPECTDQVTVPAPAGVADLRVGLSPDPVCPRCRRPQAVLQAGCCAPCWMRSER